MSSHDPPITPQPTGGPAYSDPLLEYIGNPVTVEWCGREAEGVVRDVDLEHADHRIEGRLTIFAMGFLIFYFAITTQEELVWPSEE